MPVPPPPPFHILRAHAAPLSCLHFSAGNTQLLAGDQDGVVSVSGLRARRVLCSWSAHDGGVLGVGEWAGGVVSQGRDNTVKFYDRLDAASTGGGAATAPPPTLRREMPANALNFCRFSLAYLPGESPSTAVPVAEGGGDTSLTATSGSKDNSHPAQALLALPNLTDSELVDIYAVPSLDRIGAAVNFRPGAASTAGGAARSGLVMGLHVAVVSRGGEDRVALVAGYEDGRVEVWTAALNAFLSRAREWDGRRETDALWTCVWSAKAHNEAVMALAVDPDFTRAFTASADHILARVDLNKALDGDDAALRTYPTTHIGNSALAVSSDGRVLAVGGWDGKIRLYSAATFKPLGTLAYHRESVQALAFASREPALGATGADVGDGADSDSDDAGEADAGDPMTWLASGAKDRRVALWSLRFGQR